MRILRQVDHGVLWLPEGPAETLRNLRREAELRGISPGRLIFAPRLANHADHLSRLAAADLFLDTSPYNAHTTAIDALAAGVPVLTCPGEAMASRVAASMLNTLDLKSLIAPTISAYEEKAVNLGRDARELSLLKAALGRNRANSPLFSVDQLARSLERAFVAMYERARNGLAPDHLDVTL
jgi:predicted O-linked N-acetylglucosamine transferase (SPINDLY family)